MKNLTLECIEQKLKDSPDIVGKSKYSNCAVLIPLIPIDDEWHLLFEKRAPAIRQGGEIGFPGGEFDPSDDNSLFDTAVRETCEELGITGEQITVLNKFGTLVTPFGVTIDVFTGLLNIKSLSQLNIDHNEVEKVFTIPLNYFLLNEPDVYFSRFEIHTKEIDENGNEIDLLPVEKLRLPEFYARPWKGGKHRVIVYPLQPDILWGITAEIVYEFSMLLKKN